MKIFTNILLILASILVIYNATLLDFKNILQNQSGIALIGVIASFCAICILLIFRMSKKIEKIEKNK